MHLRGRIRSQTQRGVGACHRGAGERPAAGRREDRIVRRARPPREQEVLRVIVVRGEVGQVRMMVERQRQTSMWQGAAHIVREINERPGPDAGPVVVERRVVRALGRGPAIQNIRRLRLVDT